MQPCRTLRGPGNFLRPTFSSSNHDTTKHATMEDDRAATNLGPSTEDGMTEEPAQVPRQPKRRFVGRKTAEVAGRPAPTDPNANIEDSSAIQGVRSPKASPKTAQSLTDTLQLPNLVGLHAP
jgi:hypothetical protein